MREVLGITATTIYLIVLALAAAILLAIYVFILVAGYVLGNLSGGAFVCIAQHGLSVIAKTERRHMK